MGKRELRDRREEVVCVDRCVCMFFLESIRLFSKYLEVRFEGIKYRSGRYFSLSPAGVEWKVDGRVVTLTPRSKGQT